MADENLQGKHKIRKKESAMDKKICYILCTLFLFGAVGCQQIINESLDSDSSFSGNVSETESSLSSEQNSSSSYFDGVSDWECYHRLTSIEEYRSFYEGFVNYNEERYFIPIMEKGETFETTLYHFNAKSVVSGEFEEGKYDVEYSSEQLLRFYFKIEVPSVEMDTSSDSAFASVNGVSYNISAYNFDFERAEILLLNTKTEDYTHGHGPYYEIRIGEIVLCEFELRVRELDQGIYEQEIAKWIEKGGFIV